MYVSTKRVSKTLYKATNCFFNVNYLVWPMKILRLCSLISCYYDAFLYIFLWEVNILHQRSDAYKRKEERALGSFHSSIIIAQRGI